MTILGFLTNKYVTSIIIAILIIVIIFVAIYKKCPAPSCPTAQACPTMSPNIAFALQPESANISLGSELLNPVMPSIEKVAESVGVVSTDTQTFANTCDKNISELTNSDEVKTYCDSCVKFSSIDMVNKNLICYIRKALSISSIDIDLLQKIINGEIDKTFNIYLTKYDPLMEDISIYPSYLVGFEYQIFLWLLYPRAILKQILVNYFIFVAGINNIADESKIKIEYKYINNETENISKFYYRALSDNPLSDNTQKPYEKCIVGDSMPNIEYIKNGECVEIDLNNIIQELFSSFGELQNLMLLSENIKLPLLNIMYKFMSINYYAYANGYYLMVNEYIKVGMEDKIYITGTDPLKERINFIHNKYRSELNSFLLANKNILENNKVYESIKQYFNTSVNNIQTLLQTAIMGSVTKSNIDQQLIMDEIVNTLSQYIIDENIDITAINPEKVGPIVINNIYNMLSSVNDEMVEYLKKNVAAKIKIIIDEYKKMNENGPQYRERYIYQLRQPTVDYQQSTGDYQQQVDPYTIMLQDYMIEIQTKYGYDAYIDMFNQAYANANKIYNERIATDPTITYDQILLEEFKKVVEVTSYIPLQ